MITVKEALSQLAEGRDFDSLTAALMDLTPEQAATVHPKLNKSIATVVWHMSFWNARWLKQIADTHCEPFKEGQDDFPTVNVENWITVRDQFFNDFAELQRRAGHTNVFEKPTQFGDTVEGILLRTALHTSYHVGQVIVMRALL